MDILIASRCLPYPLHHGDRLILHHLLRGLGERGHRCDVVAFYQRPDDLRERARSAELCHEIEAIPERKRGALSYVARLARPFPRTARQSWNPRLWQALDNRLRTRRYDIVHLFGGVQVYECRDLVRRLPTIIVPYESHSLLLERAVADARSVSERVRTRAASFVARRYEGMMFTGFDRVVVISDVDRRALLRVAPSLRVSVIPNGVHVEADDSTHQPHPGPTVVFVGNYGYLPNVRAAISLVTEVLPLVKAHRPDVRVTLVGAEPPDAVRSLAGPDVEVTGWVPSVGPYLARAACFVAPMTQGAGLKNKILEAMAAGVPVITTPIGCDGLAIVDEEQALVRTEAAGLAEATLRLLGDDALGARLAIAGQTLVRDRHTWPAVARQYEALYGEVIAERQART